MQITIDIPDKYIQRLEPSLANLSQRILETLVVEAYKAQRLTSAEVGRILNLNRFEVDAFLKQHQAYLHYQLDLLPRLYCWYLPRSFMRLRTLSRRSCINWANLLRCSGVITSRVANRLSNFNFPRFCCNSLTC